LALITEADALVAAHDIGALGYFGERHILDLAGLISPEVIPIMREPTKLREYLDRSAPEYLMLHLDWYADLGQNQELIFQSPDRMVGNLEIEGTRIYRWSVK